MENLLCLQNKSAPSVQRFILKSSVCSNASLIGKPGADPGFFLGGGAFISCSNSTPINHIGFFCRIPVVLENRRSSQGGVRTPCTLPLDPPLLIYNNNHAGPARKRYLFDHIINPLLSTVVRSGWLNICLALFCDYCNWPRLCQKITWPISNHVNLMLGQ